MSEGEKKVVFTPRFTPEARAEIEALIAKFKINSEDLETIVGPQPPGAEPVKRHKASHVGAPAIFELTRACQDINRAFGGFGCYLVGSALERADWRDVDVRMILEDEAFDRLFPDCGGGTGQRWEFDPRWIVMTVSISLWLSKLTGLPVDFQFQPQTHANKVHKGRRNALGLIFAKEEEN